MVQFVLQSLKSLIAHTVKKILILRQLRSLCVQFVLQSLKSLIAHAVKKNLNIETAQISLSPS